MRVFLAVLPVAVGIAVGSYSYLSHSTGKSVHENWLRYDSGKNRMITDVFGKAGIEWSPADVGIIEWDKKTGKVKVIECTRCDREKVDAWF